MVKHLMLLFFTSLALVINAKDVNVTGSYSFVLPSDLSEAEGKETAVQRARLQALADEFGTVISSEVWTDVRNDNSVSSTSLWQLGSSFVKGVWIKDTKNPVVTKTLGADGETVINATVWGVARKVDRAAVDLEAYLSVPGSGVSLNRFANGSRFTLFFKSPVKGYLSVFLSDENGDVCRLLPFAMDDASAVKINAMEQYEFFTSQRGIEEQYEFRTNGKKERNLVYIIFSTNPYIRPLDSYYSDRNLRILSQGEFHEWLGRQKAADNDLTVSIIPVEIVNQK